jgi:hypothetical protein
MSHLIEEYAKSCGVKIGKPIINHIFFSIPFEKYITINHACLNATTYDYWEEVIELLRPQLNKKNIKIVQILQDEKQKINHCDFHAYCSKKQAAFIIKNSLCHIGTDSIYCSLAGDLNTPLLGIYSHTNPKNSGPWKFDKKKTEFIISISGNQKFSYDANENPKTINKIFPEKIAEKILNLLGLKNKKRFKTLFIGDRYKTECVEIIPNEHCSVIHDKINVRMDIHHNEEVLYEIIKNNTVELTLSNPISEEILLSRRIRAINYLANEFDEIFVKKVKSLGIHLNLLCVSKDKLAQQRRIFFDYDIIFHDMNSLIKENSKKISNINEKDVKLKSNKTIFIGSKQFSSYLEAINSNNLFLLDLDWVYLYTTS